MTPEQVHREAVALEFAKAIIQGLTVNHALMGTNVKDKREKIIDEAYVWADAFIAKGAENGQT